MRVIKFIIFIISFMFGVSTFLVKKLKLMKFDYKNKIKYSTKFKTLNFTWVTNKIYYEK